MLRPSLKLAILFGSSWTAAAVAQVAPGDPAAAPPQSAPSSEQAASGTSGDIVVTARRRAENLENVPIAISAISSDSIKTQAIVAQQDLQRVVPGLTVRATSDRNSFNYSIRGQTVDNFSGSFPGVLSYVNDFQVTAISRSTFYDIASVQVLKGPQGTLFGRNTTGGAVLISTNMPTDRFEGYLQGSYGDYNLRELQGAINVPLTDSLQVRIAGDLRRRDGYGRNLSTGERIDNDHNDNFRATIRWKPTSAITNTAVFDYSHSQDHSGNILYSVIPCTQGGLAACLYSPTNVGQFGLPSYAALLAANPGLPPGGLPQRFAERSNKDFWDSYLNDPVSSRARNWFVTNTTEVSLGSNVQLKNIFGYSSQILHQIYDSDATDLPILGYIPPKTLLGSDVPLTDNRQISNEFQIQGKALDNRLTWITGLYYSRATLRQSDLFYAFAFPPFYPGTITHNNYLIHDRSIGLFAQGTYDLSSIVENLSFTGGFRWTWERVDFRRIASAINAASPLQKTSEGKPSWTVSLDYKAAPGILLYLANRGSWRTGGFSGTADLRFNSFAPETTVDVEAGFKAQKRIGGMPALLNVALFDQWVKNTQRNIPIILDNGSPGATTLNAPGGSRVRGIEVTASINPARWAQIGVNYAYNDAVYGSPTTIDILGVASTLGPYADTPKNTASAYAQLEFPLGANAGTLRLRGDYYVQSKFYFSNFGATTEPGSRVAPYHLVNFHAEVEDIAHTGATLGFTMKNAFNRRYVTGGIPTGSTLGYDIAVPGEPRTFWFDLSYKF